MSLALRSGKAYPREADKAEARASPSVSTNVNAALVHRRYSDVVRTGSPSAGSGKGDVAKGNRPRSASDSNIGLNEESFEISGRRD
jgi:hypothetical protein